MPKPPKTPRASSASTGSPNPQGGQNSLTPVPDSGTPPATRIEDADQARRVFTTLFDADRVSQWNRVRVQEMLDGVPPMSTEETQQQGNAFRTNLNFGEGQAIVEAALSAYYDLLEAPETICRIALPEVFPDAAGMEDILAEEVNRLFRRDWTDFDHRWDVLSAEFVCHGVGIAYFPDDIDWKWDSGGWDDFYIPRDTRVSEDEVEVLIGVRRMPVHKLYAKVRDAKYAAANGWNVEAVKREIVLATQGTRVLNRWGDYWAETEKRLKNNDFGMSYGNSTVVTLLHFWVKEFSGKISHYITTRDTSGPQWLYEKRDRFEKSEQVFTLFTNFRGNNNSLLTF